MGVIMARLFDAQRMVLQAIQDAQGDSQSFIEDTRICQATKISLRDMRDWFLTLDNDELVDLALTENGMSASMTAKLDFNSTNTSPCRDMTYVVFPDRRKLLATKNLRRLVPRIGRNSLLGNRLR